MSRPRTDTDFTTLQLDHLAANEGSSPEPPYFEWVRGEA
jgi:hypothetical protein